MLEDAALIPVRPITERILDRLGRPRWAWILLWSSFALVNPIVYAATIRASGRPYGDAELLDLVGTQAALAWACFVVLWGSGVIGRQAMALRADLRRIAPDGTPSDVFTGIGSLLGPIALTSVVIAISLVNSTLSYGPLPPLAGLPLLIGYMLAIMTFVWVYLVVLADIDRLGRRPMALDTFPQDRTLGLGKIGAVASNGLGILLLAAAPVMLAGSDEPVTLGIVLTLLAIAVGLFVLSMFRLHRQMAVAKSGYVAHARRLYEEAYAPLRDSPTTKVLEQQSSALSTAQSLDARAQSLLTWPIDEGTLRFMAVVVTGVVTSVVVRALFAAIGF
jgi:hypothetical protein